MARRAQHSTRSPALRRGGRGFSFGGTGSFLLSIILLNGRTILEVDSRVLPQIGSIHSILNHPQFTSIAAFIYVWRFTLPWLLMVFKIQSKLPNNHVCVSEAFQTGTH